MTSLETLPSTMRAAVMYDVDDIRIEERPLPALAPGDVLVRTGASGVCSGDLMPWYVRKKAPFVFGHEPAGTLVAYAGEPPSLALGARVFAHHHAPCLHCEDCRAGRFVHCATWRGTALDPGGMAEYFRVPRANLADTLALPESLTFADGSLVEPLACVVKSLRRALPHRIEAALGGDVHALDGDRQALDGYEHALDGVTIYVIGAGVMGLMHVAVAAAAGARVFASDFHAGRRAAAERLGATAAFAPEEALARLTEATDGRLAEAVVCGPGSPGALEHAVAATAADGTVLMFTPIEPEARFVFDQSRAYFRDLRLVASYSCGPSDTAAALRLIACGTVTAARLAAEEFRFPAVGEAYERMQAAEVIKAIVTFDEHA